MRIWKNENYQLTLEMNRFEPKMLNLKISKVILDCVDINHKKWSESGWTTLRFFNKVRRKLGNTFRADKWKQEN